MSAGRVYSTFASALITLAMNWTHRFIGIVSMIILARLLVPEDFGIIAMASLVISLADVLLNLGVHVPLIQNQNATQDHYNAAWTLRLIQTACSTLLLFLLAPYAADYFQDERVETVVRVLSFTLLIGGLENIGIIDLQKHMQFGSEFRFRFLRRISGFMTTLVLAITFRSYWALVLGMLVESIVGSALSYYIHPMRPKIGFTRIREIFGVSQWMLLLGIGRYLRMKLHLVLIGRWESTAVMGSYTLAYEISTMPTTAIISPLNRALFPKFAKEKQDFSKLLHFFLLAQGVQTTIAIPAAIGLVMVAEQAVPLLLGERWTSAIPFVQILALIGVAQALTTSGMYILLTLGRTRLNALFVWAQVVLFASIALSPIIDRTATDVAYLLLFVSAASLLIQFFLLKLSIPSFRWLDAASVSVRPLIAATVMVIVLQLAVAPLSLAGPILLVAKIVLGAASYVLTLSLLWWMAGRPEGAETYLLDKLSGLRRGFLKFLSRRRI